jgi:hypothetical protein
MGFARVGSGGVEVVDTKLGRGHGEGDRRRSRWWICWEEVEKSWLAAVFGGALGQTVEAGTAGRGWRKEDRVTNCSTRVGDEERYSG